MAKRRKSKQGPRQRRPAQRPQSAPSRVHVPGAQTLCRFYLTDPHTGDLMDKATSVLKPILWMRDGATVKKIERAKTAEELLDLVPQATGLAETAWQDRMRQFGPEVVPLISERLKTVKNIRDKDTRDMMFEKLIAELRWRGDAGAKVLLERFDDLNDYAKSLACVALGLLGAQASADKMWAFYQKVKRNWRQTTHFVGPLWGLIDLKDERAGGALADLLSKGRDFYELFGFLSLAGDARAVVPLIVRAMQKPGEENMKAAMALLSIAHRIGRDAFMAELDKVVLPEEPREAREAFVDEILSKPTSAAEEYFALFYRGLSPDDVAQVFPGEIGR
jgi:hypothetical protein